MKSEIRIDLTAMLKWIARKWKLLIVGGIILSVAMIGLLYMNEVIAYRHETSKLYTMDVCLANMSESAERNVKLTLSMETLLYEKEDTLEALRLVEDPTEDDYIQMDRLMEEIQNLRDLNLNYRYQFDNYQNRYYDLLHGVDENDMGRDYPTVTARMVAGGIVIGIAMLASLCILLYLLSGYLHSEDELRMNFGYRVSCVKDHSPDPEDSIRLVLASDRWDKEEPAAIIEVLDTEKNAKYLSLVQDITKGRVFHDCLNDAGAMVEIGELKQAIIVAHVNETKLRALMRTDEALKALNVEVLGALLITE
jgi:hypothetical protein